jgi:hypothetical protein
MTEHSQPVARASNLVVQLLENASHDQSTSPSLARDAVESLTKLEFALRGLYWDRVDYLTLNHLGGMDNHWMRAARDALGINPDDLRPAHETLELPESLRDAVKVMERGRELLAAMPCWCPFCRQPHGVNQTPITDAALTVEWEKAKQAMTGVKASAPTCLRNPKFDNNLQGSCSAGACQWPKCQENGRVSP